MVSQIKNINLYTSLPFIISFHKNESAPTPFATFKRFEKIYKMSFKDHGLDLLELEVNLNELALFMMLNPGELNLARVLIRGKVKEKNFRCIKRI